MIFVGLLCMYILGVVLFIAVEISAVEKLLAKKPLYEAVAIVLILVFISLLWPIWLVVLLIRSAAKIPKVVVDLRRMQR